MANNKTVFLDDIFDGLGEAIDEVTNGISYVQKNTSGYASVKRNGSTIKINDDSNLPHISSNVSNLSFANRYDAFSTYIENIVIDKYDDEKRNGFDTAIRHYKEILNKNKDFKHLEVQVIKDINDSNKNQNPDKYLQGYNDGLLVLKKIFNQSKMACFRRFASKFE